MRAPSSRSLAAAIMAIMAGFARIAALPALQNYPLGSYVMDTGRAGPLVLVVAGLHGDEKSGMVAANVLVGRYGAVERGRAKGLLEGCLVVVPAANPAAIEAGSRTG
ncbi:MAG: succinylglutamate desuccinylase/aspartoacylase family protein, partial [Spirochaetota bacterium]